MLLSHPLHLVLLVVLFKLTLPLPLVLLELKELLLLLPKHLLLLLLLAQELLEKRTEHANSFTDQPSEPARTQDEGRMIGAAVVANVQFDR